MTSLNSIENFLKLLTENQLEYVDFRFTDLRGTWHHMAYPVSQITESFLKEGFFFDGSSIPAWRGIEESDMLLLPDLTDGLETVMTDPFSNRSTVIVLCDVVDPATKKPYDRDPRAIAKKAEAFLSASGIADTAYFGPEAEFFIFDKVRFHTDGHTSFYELESDEFPKNNSLPFNEKSHGYRCMPKGAYFPANPLDSMADIRTEMLSTLADMGVVVEKHHHEVAPAQHELGIGFSTLVRCADTLQTYKYVVKNVARYYGKTATFMPKPIYGDNGSGMHVHQSLWKGGKPLFAGNGYGGLSETALYFIGGILAHAKSLNSLTNPTTNIYKRLIPGFEAPVICAYSAQNRSAACRIPMGESPKSKRVEVRFPDPTANAYLAFSAMLMAGLDGIQNKIHPGDPQTVDLFSNKDVAKTLPTVAGSLREALTALAQDHQYLLKGDVFTKNVLDAYLTMKWEEVHALEHHPHPIEFLNSYCS
jgi:glutamine synthetase